MRMHQFMGWATRGVGLCYLVAHAYTRAAARVRTAIRPTSIYGSAVLQGTATRLRIARADGEPGQRAGGSVRQDGKKTWGYTKSMDLKRIPI